MKRWLAFLIVACLLLESLAAAAVRGKAAKYVGGTLSELAPDSDGRFDLGEAAVVFTPKKGQAITIPYGQVDSIEYGQKAGRRLGLALTVSILFLFSKKRKHFMTINFDDAAGKKQGAVFELAKGVVRETLTTLETKTGKRVDYESEEARKHAAKL